MEQTPALQRRLTEVVEEYDAKAAAITSALAAFNDAGNELKNAATIGGTFGNVNIETGRVHESELRRALIRSAWRHVYDGLQIERLASPADKRRFQQGLEAPAPFTVDNIRGTFGNFILDPKGNILRGLAEVFCGLDKAYRSHDKVKIGVAGLPKRVILRSVGGYGTYGKDQIESILNALAAYQGKPLVTWREINALMERPDALLVDGELPKDRSWSEPQKIVGRGVSLTRFQNGNGHLIFEPATLRDINKALAEYYGDVLPDCAEARPDKPAASTAVAKDLQYYATSKAIVDRVLADIHPLEGMRTLEPSCGDGRFLDGLRKAGAIPYGIEVDPTRAAISRAKGHSVLLANFLETEPTGDFDLVVMNPPFYGKHYAKHVLHALKFLKPGGRLYAILPATARYDHGLVDGTWNDLPVGSFSESGTNINTTVLRICVPGPRV